MSVWKPVDEIPSFFGERSIFADLRIPDFRKTICRVGNVISIQNEVNEGEIFFYIKDIFYDFGHVSITESSEGDGNVFTTQLGDCSLQCVVQYGSVYNQEYNPIGYDAAFCTGLTGDDSFTRKRLVNKFTELNTNFVAFPEAKGIMMPPGMFLTLGVRSLLSTFSDCCFKEKIREVNYPSDLLLTKSLSSAEMDWNSFVKERIECIEQGRTPPEWSPSRLLNVEERIMPPLKKTRMEICEVSSSGTSMNEVYIYRP